MRRSGATLATAACGVSVVGAGTATTCAGRLGRALDEPRERAIDAEDEAPSALTTNGAWIAIGRAHPGQASALSETLRPQSGHSVRAMRDEQSTNRAAARSDTRRELGRSDAR